MPMASKLHTKVTKPVKPNPPRATRTDDQLDEIAIGGIEQGLDCDPETDSADTIYDDCYNLAFDALLKARVDRDVAREVAKRVAQRFAQP